MKLLKLGSHMESRMSHNSGVLQSLRCTDAQVQKNEMWMAFTHIPFPYT